MLLYYFVWWWTLNLNKNKKTFVGIRSLLQNKKESSKECRHPKKVGEECYNDFDCISYECRKKICVDSPLKKLGVKCFCDYHCKSGHCSFYWLAYLLNGNIYICTKD